MLLKKVDHGVSVKCSMQNSARTQKGKLCIRVYATIFALCNIVFELESY